jgi:hypothetical protein
MAPMRYSMGISNQDRNCTPTSFHRRNRNHDAAVDDFDRGHVVVPERLVSEQHRFPAMPDFGRKHPDQVVLGDGIAVDAAHFEIDARQVIRCFERGFDAGIRHPPKKGDNRRREK